MTTQPPPWRNCRARRSSSDSQPQIWLSNASLSALAEADNYDTHDPYELAVYLRKTIFPMMNSVRHLADTLETWVAHDLWPLPSYRELLFFK